MEEWYLMFQDCFLGAVDRELPYLDKTCKSEWLCPNFPSNQSISEGFRSISLKASDVGTCFQKVWSFLVQCQDRTFELSGGRPSNHWVDDLAWIHWGPGKAVKVPLGPGKTGQSRWFVYVSFIMSRAFSPARLCLFCRVIGKVALSPWWEMKLAGGKNVRVA